MSSMDPSSSPQGSPVLRFCVCRAGTDDANAFADATDAANICSSNSSCNKQQRTQRRTLRPHRRHRVCRSCRRSVNHRRSMVPWDSVLMIFSVNFSNNLRTMVLASQMKQRRFASPSRTSLVPQCIGGRTNRRVPHGRILSSAYTLASVRYTLRCSLVRS